MVVCGKVPRPGSDDGAFAQLDELSTLGENAIAEFYHEKGFLESALDPRQFPLQPAVLADLAGGNRDANAGIVRRILNGDDRGPRRDAVLLNAAAALLVAGSVTSMTAGWALAEETIDGGLAGKKLQALIRHPCGP
jgi:anthranilate phosphoribosyltransferase